MSNSQREIHFERKREREMRTDKLTGGICPVCPKCGLKLDGFTDPDGHEHPLPGDFTICVGCAGMLRYTDTLSLKIVTPEDLLEAGAETQETLVRTREVVFEAIKRKKQRSKLRSK